jgi:outer membrane protein TolC
MRQTGCLCSVVKTCFSPMRTRIARFAVALFGASRGAAQGFSRGHQPTVTCGDRLQSRVAATELGGQSLPPLRGSSGGFAKLSVGWRPRLNSSAATPRVAKCATSNLARFRRRLRLLFAACVFLAGMHPWASRGEQPPRLPASGGRMSPPSETPPADDAAPQPSPPLVTFPARGDKPPDRPSQKSPLEQPPTPGGEVLDMKPPPAEPGDLRFPINLATALRLADARPIIVSATGANVWVAEATLQKSKVLWVPTINLGADYSRHDGIGPDLNNGINIPKGVNALGQPSPGALGRPLSQNVNLFYGGGGFTWAPSGDNYFFQPNPGLPLMPSPQFQFATDMIFQPLHDRQALNSARWDLQAAKNDALFMTATAYFNVHRQRGRYAVAIDAVQRGRQLVAQIAELSTDLVPRVEIDRARNLLADLEQEAVTARQNWRIASAELTRVLRLDPRAVVEPLEHDHLQVTLFAPSRSLDELIPIALTNRPELASHQALVQAMLVAIRQEKLRPLLPSLYMNGFQTPYELLEAGAGAIGHGNKLNQWSPRDDLSPEMIWAADGLGLKNLAQIKEARGMSSQQLVALFQMQDSIAGGVTRTQADLQSAAARVVQAEREVKSALINYNGNVEGLAQTQRFGNILIQVFRPQEVVFALQLLMTAYEHYIDTVAEYNTAQFAMFHELGYPAREIAFSRRAGAVVPVNTQRPSYLPPVGTGAPPATR